MSEPLVSLVVHGMPAPQGSKRAVVHRSTGRAVTMESSKRVGPWREAVKHAALADGFGPNLDEALLVDMVFTFVRPRAHYRTGRNAHLLKDGVPRQPASAPDLSKLARSTEDALTDAGVWRDDARVAEYGRLAKVWAGEDPDALAVPGAVIRVWRLADLVTTTGVAA